MSFNPPSIQHAQTGHSVEGGFHAACPGSFLRLLRSIDPRIHTGAQVMTQRHIVIFEINHGYQTFHRSYGLKDTPDDGFAAFITGMSLASVNNLQRTYLTNYSLETVQIRE